MADIRCPHCGKTNPDFLDVCQFCQTPLKSESMLHIGEKPTKKNTGELETVLPEWLRDVRQQARDSAEEEATQAARSRPQKEEAPDLLAGLASQSRKADEDDIPDWLASINPEAKPKSSAPSTPEPETDFFAQFNKSESTSTSANEPIQKDTPSWIGDVTSPSQPSLEKDELSDWFSQASEQSDQPVQFEPGATQDDMSWMSNFDSLPASTQESAPKEEEDLSWLHNLEASAKQTGDLPPPKQDTSWMANFETPSTPSQPSDVAQGNSSAPEELSWLNKLGGIDETSQSASSQPAPQQADLSWLNQFDATSKPSQPSEPSTPYEDLSWLDKLGGISESSSFASPESPEATAAQAKPTSSQPPAAQEDLSWLNNLSAPAEPSQPPIPQDDLRWLNNLGGESEPLSTPPFSETTSTSQDDLSWLKNMEGPSDIAPSPTEATSPRQTAPLSGDSIEQSMPDWLKNATEEPSMPAPGELSMDWFKGTSQPAGEEPLPSKPKPVSIESNLFTPSSEASPLSNQDVDSLFSVEMPDWLSRPESGTGEAASQPVEAPLPEGNESLAPVDLPSWVQAMRPVEAVISEAGPNIEDQPSERDGPLAGLRGVIPLVPIGSSRRPKALSLTLQVTDEQQTSAALLEQILGSETSPRALVSSSFMIPQRVLRWTLTGLFLIVLSAIIALRSQTMAISADLPVEVSGISNIIANIPDNAKVLIVIDYEPSLAGEMEAVSGPLLDQMVLLRHPNFSFLSTSPNGSALVERLMTNTKVNGVTGDGLGYQSGVQYFNLGYLPGGSAGVLGFLETPSQIIPAADVTSFSEYAALVVLTDHAESGRVWVEQLQNVKQSDPALANQPLLVVASAQAGPLLQPYVLSRQITGMISGLSDAARYEFLNNSRPGIARSYWDAFGIGLMMAIAAIIVGSLWSLLTGMRARRADTAQG
jgi:hypothetical protein